MDSVYPTSMILELAGGKEGEMITTLSDARHMLGTCFFFQLEVHTACQITTPGLFHGQNQKQVRRQVATDTTRLYK